MWLVFFWKLQLTELFVQKDVLFPQESGCPHHHVTTLIMMSIKNLESRDFHVLIHHLLKITCFALRLNSETHSGQAKTKTVFSKKLTCWRHSSVFFSVFCVLLSSSCLSCVFPQIAGYVNQPMVDVSILQRSLAILESMVLNSHSLYHRVAQEITVGQLIGHLQVWAHTHAQGLPALWYGGGAVNVVMWGNWNLPWYLTCGTI